MIDKMMDGEREYAQLMTMTTKRVSRFLKKVKKKKMGVVGSTGLTLYTEVIQNSKVMRIRWDIVSLYAVAAAGVAAAAESATVVAAAAARFFL